MKLIFTLPLAAAQQASLIDNGCRPASQPPMIYGTAWKKEKTDKLVQLALKKGFRAIDTAGMPEHYDERLTGIGINAAIAEGNLRDLSREIYWHGQPANIKPTIVTDAVDLDRYWQAAI